MPAVAPTTLRAASASAMRFFMCVIPLRKGAIWWSPCHSPMCVDRVPRLQEAHGGGRSFSGEATCQCRAAAETAEQGDLLPPEPPGSTPGSRSWRRYHESPDGLRGCQGLSRAVDRERYGLGASRPPTEVLTALTTWALRLGLDWRRPHVSRGVGVVRVEAQSCHRSGGDDDDGGCGVLGCRRSRWGHRFAACSGRDGGGSAGFG